VSRIAPLTTPLAALARPEVVAAGTALVPTLLTPQAPLPLPRSSDSFIHFRLRDLKGSGSIALLLKRKKRAIWRKLFCLTTGIANLSHQTGTLRHQKLHSVSETNG
jgi:hypothetical protein